MKVRGGKRENDDCKAKLIKKWQKNIQMGRSADRGETRFKLMRLSNDDVDAL